MAEIPVLEAAPTEAAAALAGKRKKLIVIAAAALIVLAGGSAGAWFLLEGGEHPQEGKEKAEEVAPKGPPLYVALEPPFVVNFEADSNVRFLQVTVQLMTRDPATVEQLKSNDPVIRNDLLLLLGNQHYENIASREGKEKLRQESLDTVRHIVKDAGGKSELLEAVYFTSFVMQ